MTQMIEWFTMWTPDKEPESDGKFPLDQTDDGDYICPKCGKPAEYDEGEIDQDRQGNYISGWWFACWNCHIDTEAVEGTFNG